MKDFPLHKLPEYILKDYFGMTHPTPKQLFVRGIFPTDSHLIFLTIVGSRKCTPYGSYICKQLIQGLRGYPIIIVSGLAVGIDTVAHETALEVGLLSVAFPGSGLGEKTIYPKSNHLLAKNILEYGGCLVSELDETTEGNTWTFPARNRLMAGLSKATLVIEGSHTSGSRITARLATEYNRDVLATPGPIFSESSEAPNALIRLGATPITSSQDILEALGFQITETAPLDLFSQCSPEEQQVLKLLTKPMSRGDIIRALDINISKANILLSQMELRGLIVDQGGELRRG